MDSPLDKLFGYQARLQGVANSLGEELAKISQKSGPAVLELLKKELPKKESDLKAEFTRLGLLVARVANVRKEAFKSAEKYTFDTCGQVVDKSSEETALAVDALVDEPRRKPRESFFGKELTDKQKKAILDTYEINGKTILDWMKNWEAGDIERIASACQKASVESLSVADIVKKINGTRAENYEDGILSTTRKSATMMARTLINGVSNNTRMETIKANSDVIDGIKFLGTLDGKTCPYCAQFDGRIWEPNEIDSVPRPPIHPNCRCTILPWIQLKDADGNDIDLEYDRPAANADFEKLAEEAYNKTAKEKGLKRRWKDLAQSTRLKYYYKAQKDFEARTGKPAYRQVPGTTTFYDYFEKQPEEFKLSWLGPSKYSVYHNENTSLKELEKIVLSPSPTFTRRVDELLEEETPDPIYDVLIPSYDGLSDNENDYQIWLERVYQQNYDVANEFLNAVEQAKITAEENIKAHKPLKGDFRKEEAYSTAIDAWQGNIERNASFYGRLLRIVRDVIDERSKKDPVFKPEKFVWETKYGVFTSESIGGEI